MCGIAGMATVEGVPARERLAAMCAVMRHRGPDGEGAFIAPGIALGMRRLAVLDIEGGAQPVQNASGTVQAVFNGEIYNYRELRAELRAAGVRLRGSGDSEVIPHLYELHGPEFVLRLNGMFAIALWDARTHRLLLVRDRMGIKPLFYAERGGTLYFGSEVKSILVAGGSAGSVDAVGLDQLLSLEYTLAPRTLLADVCKLEPGTALIHERGHSRIVRWWNALREPVSSTPRSVPEWCGRLRETFAAAVRRQNVADVPLGAFLSGGLDSSILVATLARVSASPPLTFTVGFKDAGYDELVFARRVAQRYGTRHQEEILVADYQQLLPEVMSQLDQPIADFSVFPTLLVAHMARRHVTVALGGDGGDELFAGYDTYAADRLSARWLDLLPQAGRAGLARAVQLLPPGTAKRGLANQLRRFLEGSALPRSWQHLRWMVFLSDAQRQRLYTPAFHALVRDSLARQLESAFVPTTDRLDAQMRCDLRWYLPDNILQKVDAMSMACSLEARVPWLDNEVVDLALAMPSDLKYRQGVRKWILREAFREDLPPQILTRGKEGFSMPMKHWLRAGWNELMHELLAPAQLSAEGYFDSGTVAQLMREHERGQANHSHLLWALMVYQLWRARLSDSAATRTRMHAA